MEGKSSKIQALRDMGGNGTAIVNRTDRLPLVEDETLGQDFQE